MLSSILSDIRLSLSSQSQAKPVLFNLKGGVGVYSLCINNYTTPPPEITLATLRYALSEAPRPFPSSAQAMCVSIALCIAQEIPSKMLPTGVSPINQKAPEASLKYFKRIADSKLSAKHLLNQVGYRVSDVSQAIEDLAIDACKLAIAKRDYESI